ncbi:checkpoint protein hus1 [Salvia miltiorrhiza]|uniref:checkpoint protein hus1 n=1 Tax=Salvia miltiorrhiza TaxID=226208 RepID=UPI0025AB7C99|nr:checkpoint protein hus1 [Salvia miltiorrhiza]
MKFKAFLTENGINLLEKRILPALDKMGRVCHLYLTRDHAFFLHNLLSADGVHSVAQFSKESLFHDYRISSNNDDRIAFSVDLSLLHRALRSVLAIRDANSNALLIKLVKKLPPNSTQATPFLTFEARGHKSAVVQDVPVSKPLSRADVHELHLAVESCEQLPATLVMAPELNSLHNFVDGMKHVGDVMGVSVSKYGDLHLQISTSLISLGAEFRKLRVLGERADPVAEDEGVSAQIRAERGVQRGDAMSVQVSVKHFFKSLQCSLAKPDCAFFGIAPQSACLMLFFQFFVPGTRLTDNSFSLHCRLPVLDTGST